MKIFFCDHITIPLPDGHRFPKSKYALVRERILENGLAPPATLIPSIPASDDEILRVHTLEYLHKIKSGALSDKEQRRIGFPWSAGLVERSLCSVGGTLAACRTALIEGVAANLAGGTHHAYPDHGEGFCVFNDCAVAARAMQAEALAEKILILDCDVHQGNGTASIFSSDPSVFTFSIHGAKNFPFHKEESDLDIALDDGSDDQTFLTALRSALAQILPRFQADLVIYLAGSDPFIGDRLGRLAMTKAGLAERDLMIFETCQNAGLPVAVVMAGGYARMIEDMVEIHYRTISLALEYHQRGWQ